jgi:hypothetical protein
MSLRNFSVGCPNKTTSTLYYHNASAAVSFSSYTNTISSIFSPTYNGLAFDFWKPNNPNSTLTQFEPGSSYQITAKTNITIRQEGFYIASSIRFVGPLITFVALDNNSLPVTIASLPIADKNKINTIWTTNNDKNCDPYIPFYWDFWKNDNPSSGLTTLQPGSAYYIITNGSFSLNLPRRNQYIITHPTNTPPNAFIKTQRGDYLITQQSG